jgi:hypothetical protein
MREFDSPRTHQILNERTGDCAGEAHGRKSVVRGKKRDRFALEAHKDEHPAFNRVAVGSIPIGRTRSFHEDVGKRSSRQTFNLEIAGSIFHGAQRTSPVRRIPPSLPCVPLVQWITTRVYETRNSGSSPERDTKFERTGASPLRASNKSLGRVFQRPGWGTVYASTGVRFPSRPPRDLYIAGKLIR